MKVVYVSALVVLALVSLAGMAQAEQKWVTEQITSGGNTWQPAIWGDTVYWTDRRSGHAEVYVWDKQGGERRLIDGPESQGVASAYEDKVVVARRVNNKYDLYLWDSTHGLRTITTAPGSQPLSDIYGETVVWEDHRTEISQIYIWDPINGERPLSPYAGAYQTKPKIWGDTVVWQDGRNGRSDVYMWNPRDGERLLSTYESMISPAIYEDRVVMWALHDPYAPINDPGLWEWTPKGGLRWVFESYPWSFENTMYTQLWGDMVVWQNGNPGGIQAWDPAHGLSTVSRSVPGDAMLPSFQGNKVAWVGKNNLYVSTLVPEPSGCLMLAAGALLLIRRRRRA